MMRKGFNDQAFEKVSTENEGALKLKDCLSYDEMKLSAFVGLAGLTSFINKGDRNNNGKPGGPGSFEKEGFLLRSQVHVLKKKDFMDYQDIFVTRTQNTPDNGYGQDRKLPVNEKKAKALEPFAAAYKQKNNRFPTYEEVEKIYDSYADKAQCDYIFALGKFINKSIYKERIRLSLEPMLDTAVDFSTTQGDKPSFISVPGIGLSESWSAGMFDELGALQLEVYYELLHDTKYAHIGMLDFNYFAGSEKCLETFTRFFETNPDKLPQQFSYTYGSRKDGGFKQYAHGKEGILREGSSPVGDKYLLIRVLPWDSNAGIGNEIFIGRLNASGDPACACSSTIFEVLNSFINKNFVKITNIYYCGNQVIIEATQTVSPEQTASRASTPYIEDDSAKIKYTPAHFKPETPSTTTQPQPIPANLENNVVEKKYQICGCEKDMINLKLFIW